MIFYLITNSPNVAAYAVEEGVDRIFVDLETIGKISRQGHLSTVISDHSIADVAAVRKVVPISRLIVRTNPLNPCSREEIEDVLAAGADILMLPMFSTAKELREFAHIVDGRARTIGLLETRGAYEDLGEILDNCPIDEFHVGLNDLSLEMGFDFMFEPFVNGVLENITSRFHAAGMKFGIGGLARINEGQVPAKDLIAAHVRFGSCGAILSRTFQRGAETVTQMQDEVDLQAELAALRNRYEECLLWTPRQHEEAFDQLTNTISAVSNSVAERRALSE